METLTFSLDVLTWAADRVGKSLESLAEVITRRDKDRARLLEGQLTASQAQKLAKLTGVPFGLLFLKEPPELPKPTLPDLRQTFDPLPLSKDFEEVLEDAIRKQEWYVEYLKEIGARPLNFVGRFNSQSRAADIAEDICSELGISEFIRKEASSPEEYFTALAERAEACGILVMKTGIVKSNTQRPLSVSEFRGFAIADKFAPLIFINGRDAEVAAVFTLMHEIAHIWTGQSGISDLGTTALKGVERLCNQVAAEILAPKTEFLRFWQEYGDISIVAKKFRVSRVVIARRALELGLINQQQYNAIVIQSRNVIKKESEGGSPYRTLPVRNSKRLTAALVRGAMSGEIMLRDAASLLHVRPDTVMELGRRVKDFG